MLLLGYDIGSSSVKVALIDGKTGELLGKSQSPKRELAISSKEVGWAEQDPETWWEHLKNATKLLFASTDADQLKVGAIGIAYQMHGLVVTGSNGEVIRPSIIWCDSRATGIGEKAFKKLGAEDCLKTLLNSPGNFTASKLKWVKTHEPAHYEKIRNVMLPGDYIAFRFTGDIRTTIGGLSEGTFWNFSEHTVHQRLLDYYGIDKNLLPEIVPVFGDQGTIKQEIAKELGFSPKVKISYRAGDQPNNAFALNVNTPGEIAATAGTSGVVYAIVDELQSDPLNRVNTFAHVTHSKENIRLGVLMCVNGTGSAYGWLRKVLFPENTYEELENMAQKAPPGAGGLTFLPFGNGIERMFGNKHVSAGLHNVQFNSHSHSHVVRSVIEGIAFALVYGIDRLKEMGIAVKVIHAGNDNLFQSQVFSNTIATLTGAEIHIKPTTGAIGAALGAGLGIGWYKNNDKAFSGQIVIKKYSPDSQLKKKLDPAYQRWSNQLKK